MNIKTLLFLIISLNLFSQSKDQISLPEGGEDIKITKFTNLFSLYVTKNQEVYNDDKKLEYFQQIAFTLQKQKNSLEPWMPLKVLLYVDEKVKYSFIDKIKSLIPFPKWLYYMTDNIEGLKATTFKLNQGVKEHLILEKITTLEEDIYNKENSIEGGMIEIGLSPELQLGKDLYEVKKEAVEKKLNTLSNETIIVSKKKTLNHKEKSINNEILKKLIKQNRILFLKFDNDIYYEDYLHAIQEIKQVYKSLNKTGESWAYIIEVSFELERLLKEAEIKL